ncbi:MAG: hypothetical protein V2A73_11525 [Pseudomonadota bacterium]
MIPTQPSQGASDIDIDDRGKTSRRAGTLAPEQVVTRSQYTPPAPRDASREMAGGALLAFLIALPVSLLPEPWRRKLGHSDADLPLASATIVSGIGELACGLLLAVYFCGRLFRTACLDLLTTAGQSLSEQGGNAHQLGFGIGALLFVSFLLSPVGMLCLALFAEGLARAVGGLVTGEPHASGILGAIEALCVLGAKTVGHARVRLRGRAPAPDEITREPDGSRLTIRTCRAREWSCATVLDACGELWCWVGHEKATAPPYRHTYRFRPMPANSLVRQVTRYVPDT